MTIRQPMEDDCYNLRSGITLFPSHDKVIDLVLTDLVHAIPAHFVLLTDVTGQIISARGERDHANLVALASLAAGDLAASQEIARLTGEYQHYQMILREGQKTHTFILGAGSYLVLLVQVLSNVPLGWARMLIQEAARRLADIVVMTPEEIERSDPALSQEDLPDLFGSALEDLWSE
jgi:predicted regulator of Ras-like GTPase activity (Roadblock/LC7/MglB family)